MLFALGITVKLHFSNFSYLYLIQGKQKLKIQIIKSLFLVALLSICNPANATLMYSVDSGWESFSWSGAPGVASNEGGFTFELLGDGELTVVDAYAFGDEFEIWINGIFNTFTTDVADFDNSINTSDPDSALAAGFSQAKVFLTAGTYNIDFKLFQAALMSAGGSPFTGGGAYFKVETVTSVSEPSTLAILSLSLIGLVSRRFTSREASKK